MPVYIILLEIGLQKYETFFSIATFYKKNHLRDKICFTKTKLRSVKIPPIANGAPGKITGAAVVVK